MVERLLILLVAMALVMLVMSAETGLAARTRLYFTSTENKRPYQVNFIPLAFLPRLHVRDGNNSSLLGHIDKGSLTPHEGDLSRKSIQDVPTLGALPGVLDPRCLHFLRCQDENIFYFDRMEIYHADLPERSAAACGHLCLRQQPDARLVMAKLSPINKQLVCGCGDWEALPSLSVSGDPPNCSQPCPDGEDSCGGDTAISVYQVARDKEECVAPSYSYHGCYYGEVGAGALTLGPWERWGGGCQSRCRAQSNSGPLMRLSTAADGTTLCECGVTEAELGSTVVQEEQGCGWRCPDGEGWCGGTGVTSVYSYSTALGEHLLPSRLLLLLLLVLCLIRYDLLA